MLAPNTALEDGLAELSLQGSETVSLKGRIIKRDANRYTVEVLNSTNHDVVYLDGAVGTVDIMDLILIKSIVQNVVEEFTIQRRETRQFFLVTEVVSPTLVKLVGMGCPMPILARVPRRFRVKEHDFVSAAFAHLTEDRCIVRSDESDYIVKVATDEQKSSYFLGVRPLLPSEETEIIRPGAVTKLTEQMANQYIRDVLVALGRLNEHMQSVKEAAFILTKQVDFPSELDDYYCNGKKSLKVFLDKSETDRLINSDSDQSWRKGMDMYLHHPLLTINQRHHALRVFIGKIEIIQSCRFRKDGATVTLYLPTDSLGLFHWIEDSKELFEKSPFQIGPFIGNTCSAASVIEKNFALFYNNRVLFNKCYGRNGDRDFGNMEPQLDMNFESILINGRTLDVSQTKAANSALSTNGFTTISAPPGSGKTVTIAAMVKAEIDENPESRFYISTTTNIAVENAIDTIHANFPNMEVYRDFSVESVEKRGIVLSKETIEIWLRTGVQAMWRRIKRGADVNTELIETFEERNAAWKERASSLEEHLILIDRRHAANQKVKEEFLRQCAPAALGATTAILTRSIRRGANRLILDEAGMMTVVDAMAVYCSMPNLAHVTLLGDHKQLKPYCLLNEQSLSFFLLTRSELARLNGCAATNKQQLNTVYRCHPAIVEHFLAPIYDGDLRSGVSAEERNMASENRMPRAKDGSPFLFVHLGDSKCVQLVNHVETQAVAKLTKQLTDNREVKHSDIAVICHHKAQQYAMNQLFKAKSVPIEVQTIDSFQGKEAKVVIILMTKTANDVQDVARRLSFVSSWNRETVAVSRAQHAMYLFGDWKGLLQTDFWGQYKTMIKQTGALVDSHFRHISLDSIIGSIRDVSEESD